METAPLLSPNQSALVYLVASIFFILAATNTFGGFLVTERMLEMFKKKEPKK